MKSESYGSASTKKLDASAYFWKIFLDASIFGDILRAIISQFFRHFIRTGNELKHFAIVSGGDFSLLVFHNRAEP